MVNSTFHLVVERGREREGGRKRGCEERVVELGDMRRWRGDVRRGRWNRVCEEKEVEMGCKEGG